MSVVHCFYGWDFNKIINYFGFNFVLFNLLEVKKYSKNDQNLNNHSIFLINNHYHSHLNFINFSNRNFNLKHLNHFSEQFN